MAEKDWKIYKNETTGMWWTELDGDRIAESSSLSMAAYMLERAVKPRLPPYWSIEVYVPIDDADLHLVSVFLRLAGRPPGDIASSVPLHEDDNTPISVLVDDAWAAFEVDCPDTVVDEDDPLPPTTCGYDFFVVEASTTTIEDGRLAEWSNEEGDCHRAAVRKHKSRALVDAWQAARAIAAAHGS